jgi:hypothetical protein
MSIIYLINLMYKHNKLSCFYSYYYFVINTCRYSIIIYLSDLRLILINVFILCISYSHYHIEVYYSHKKHNKKYIRHDFIKIIARHWYNIILV